MLVLLDEQLPRHLAREIGGHVVIMSAPSSSADGLDSRTESCSALPLMRVFGSGDRRSQSPISAKSLPISARHHLAYRAEQCS